MKNIYIQILEYQSGKSPLALATVTSTSGSTPQKPGSSALFSMNGIVTGTIGGGIVEGKVQKLAVEALKSKESGLFLFNLANDISNKEDAICGGQISVLIDANLNNSVSVFGQIKKSLEERIPGVLITMVTMYNEKSVLINRYWMSSTNSPEIPQPFLEKISPVVIELVNSKNPSDYRQLEISIPGEEPASVFYLEPVFPLPKLIIAGAGHIGKALSHLGSRLDFDVTVIDDRQEFANAENLPDARTIIVGDIGRAVQNIKKGDDTYIVIVTRGHKDDAEALKPCIGTDLAYTGMIGSRMKIAAMKTHFIEQGWATKEQWDSIYAPVGIDIKSQSVEEIAVSIAAQFVLVRNSQSAIRNPKSEIS
ncbi:MAG: XdhC family protein [Bacteroidales bacterium]|nr:XdhC family protein [Bacteroidales bacterium]